MATKKITLNELRSLVKQIINEEVNNNTAVKSLDDSVKFPYTEVNNHTEFKLNSIEKFNEFIKYVKKHNHKAVVNPYNNIYVEVTKATKEGLQTKEKGLIEWYYIDFDGFRESRDIYIFIYEPNNKILNNVSVKFTPNIEIKYNYWETKADVEDEMDDYESTL
jgi:hypothetical protein